VKTQQKLIVQIVAKYSSGVALNADSLEDNTDAQNADLQDRRGHLPDLFYLSLNKFVIIFVDVWVCG
jgi:hypothetical protein